MGQTQLVEQTVDDTSKQKEYSATMTEQDDNQTNNKENGTEDITEDSTNDDTEDGEEDGVDKDKSDNNNLSEDLNQQPVQDTNKHCAQNCPEQEINSDKIRATPSNSYARTASLALHHIMDITGEYVYVVAIQATKTILFDDGFNGLNVLGYLSSFDIATITARGLSFNIPEYNVFIFRQESGIRIKEIDYTEYCAIEKWRSGELISDDDVDEHQIIRCNNIDEVIDYYASDTVNEWYQ